MSGRGLRVGNRTVAIGIAGLAVLIFLILAGRFADVQNVWIDESTQLSGSALPPGRMFAWLGGHFEPLGVPPDRMPPVSYMIDALCGRTLCGGVIAYRWLHLILAAIGVGGVTLLAGRRYGWAAGVVSGALLALAPQMLTTGVEIRAYPIFFAVTVLQLWLLYRLIDGGRLSIKSLIAFALAGVLAIYTHFFGIVSTSALFCGLVAARVRAWGDLVRTGLAWGAVLLSAAGVAPFVMGASAISNGVENDGPPGAYDIILYMLRTIGHSSMMLHPWLTALFCIGLGVLVAIAFVRFGLPAAKAPRAVADPAFAVGVALVSGFVVTILAAFVVHGFNPMKPSYSIWMVPLLALLAGAACAGGGRVRLAALGVSGITIASLAFMAVVFESRAEWFVHGPERAIVAEVGAPASRTAIVYVDDFWAYAYFPLIYRYHGAIGQYRIDRDGQLHTIGAGGNPATPALPMAALRRYDRLLLVSIAQRSYRDLRAMAQGYVDPIGTQPINGDMIGSGAGAWNSVNAVISPGVYWLRMTRLERAAP